MAKYKLRIKKSATKELEAVPKLSDRRRIISRIEALADNPRPPGCQKLSGSEWYRIRQGYWRIVYAIEDEQLVILIIKIGDRKNIYRKL